MVLARRNTAVMALALALSVWCAGPAQAIDVTVRSRTLLSLDISAQGRRLRLTGSLRDNVFQGLSRQLVRLSLIPDVPDERRVIEVDVLTDDNGHFAWMNLLGDGAWRAEVRFVGDGLHAPATTSVGFQVQRARLELTLTTPLASPIWAPLPVSIAATSASGDVDDLPLNLYIDGAPALGGLRIASGRIDAQLDALPGTGRRIIEAVFAGNYAFEPQSSRRVVQLYETAQLELRTRVEELREARLLVVRGTLDSDAGPLAGVPVTLRIAGRTDEVVTTTDEGGRFGQVLPILALAVGETHVLGASFDPHDTGESELLVTAESAFELRGGPLVNASRWASVLAVVLLAVLLIGLGGLRLSAWLRARREAKPQAPLPGRAAPRELIELAPRRSSGGVLERRVSGRVLDADTGRPIGEGRVSVRPDGTSADGDAASSFEFPVATDGAFSTEPLEPGKYHVEVRVTGYVSTSLPVSIPHQGRFSGVDVFLCSVRSWIRYLYQQLTLELELREDGRHRWGRATPQQIEKLLVRTYRAFTRERRSATGLAAFREGLQAILADPAAVPSNRVLRALTLLVEEVYYSGRTYSADMIPLCRSLIEGVSGLVGPIGPAGGRPR